MFNQNKVSIRTPIFHNIWQSQGTIIANKFHSIKHTRLCLEPATPRKSKTCFPREITSVTSHCKASRGEAGGEGPRGRGHRLCKPQLKPRSISRIQTIRPIGAGRQKDKLLHYNNLCIQRYMGRCGHFYSVAWKCLFKCSERGGGLADSAHVTGKGQGKILWQCNQYV